ncbi:MAG TPA: tRNA (adenosine(37)-N6)-threonylcarbamoyltransferase complex dimerization subunit type 1 TsaB [Candidatus Saccharimonadales bacterium]|jgi:tRNA threonylcarbamoyladenosine biosynthesis protein TsaB|nr:tRNA (adenosine(37)-N6)-threonylcarbamoyltransferase complex dimerization subunit type 1 TsaB [Candidatus Saccharimonadales bacterium]
MERTKEYCMILSLKTDSPDAELALFDVGGTELHHETWHADRALAKGLHAHIETLLKEQHKGWEDITGVIIFRGPGSFTGLRIGITVANTLAYGLDVPIIGEMGQEWQQTALTRIKNHENDRIILPHYGSEATITKPKK